MEEVGRGGENGGGDAVMGTRDSAVPMWSLFATPSRPFSSGNEGRLAKQGMDANIKDDPHDKFPPRHTPPPPDYGPRTRPGEQRRENARFIEDKGGNTTE